VAWGASTGAREGSIVVRVRHVGAGYGEAGANADASKTTDSGNVAPEAGACGASATGACNALANVGTAITPTCVAGASPAMTGGAIADGTYVLVSGTAYASSCSGVTLPAGGPTTLLVSAGCIQSVDVTGGAKTYAWSTSGSTFTMSEVCPAASPPADLQYTATPTTLSQLAQSSPQLGLVSVFQKQ